MKLIELMLNAGAQWPVGATHAAQDASRTLRFYTGECGMLPRGMYWTGRRVKTAASLPTHASDWNTHAVTREEYQAAGGWMLWEGGECPVARGTLVDAKYRDGNSNEHIEAGVAESKTGSRAVPWATNWKHSGAPHDIVAYRVIPAAQTFEPFVSVENMPLERIAKAANIDTLDDTLTQLTQDHNQVIRNQELVAMVAEAFGCEPEDIPAQLKVQHTAAVRGINRICKLVGMRSVMDTLASIERMQDALRFYADRNNYEHGDVPGHVYALDDAGGLARDALMISDGPYACDKSTDDSGISLSYRSATHTIYHDGEMYRDSTILLDTKQLLVWSCGDQEYAVRRHQALINPDDNGLAAAILARLSGADIAPEHIIEMREQMGWKQ